MKKSHHDEAAERLIEEQTYAQVVQELAGGQRRDGLWAKAISDSGGSEEKAKSLYIRYRVQSLKDEAIITSQLHEEEIAAQKKKKKQEEQKEWAELVRKDLEFEKARKKTSIEKFKSNLFQICERIIFLVIFLFCVLAMFASFGKFAGSWALSLASILLLAGGAYWSGRKLVE